jgi:hypothetical protein
MPHHDSVPDLQRRASAAVEDILLYDARGKAVLLKKPVGTDELPRAAAGFSIHQATLGMGAIFTGFVFAALFQLLTRQELTRDFDMVIGLLLLAMLALTTALIYFHATWLQFVKYVGIITPQSTARMAGGFFFQTGITAMIGALGALLWARHMRPYAFAVGIWCIAFWVFAIWLAGIYKGTRLCTVD